MNLLLLLTPFTLLISFIFLFTVRTIRAQLLVGGMFVTSTVGISTVVGSTQYWVRRFRWILYYSCHLGAQTKPMIRFRVAGNQTVEQAGTA